MFSCYFFALYFPVVEKDVKTCFDAKKMICSSEWHVEHLFAGQNIQQISTCSSLFVERCQNYFTQHWAETSKFDQIDFSSKMIAHTFTKDGLRWQMHLVAEVIVGFTLQPNLDQSGCDFLLILFIKFSPSNIKHFCNEVEHYIYISTDYRLVYIFMSRNWE